MGQHLKVASTSSVAASDRGGASMTMRLTSSKVPQSHLNSSMSIWSLTEGRDGSPLGKDKSCTILCSDAPTVLGTVPRGDVRNGPIKDSNFEREKGPE